MKKILTLFTLLTLVNCSTAHKKSEPQKQQKIITLKNEFIEFWSKAKNQSFDEQLQLWNNIVEKDHQDFFNSFSWSKAVRKDWKERKHKKLKKYFNFYAKNYDKIIIKFDNFENTLKAQIVKYKQRFPDADFSLDIYAVPSGGSFNGRAGDIQSNPGVTVLAFGMDMMTFLNDDPDVLYAHELFHIYHTNKLDITEETAKKTKITMPLWLEGLATYVSGEFNPKASDGTLLLDSELEKYKKDLPWMAKAFLKISDQLGWDDNNPNTYYQWFALGKHKPRKDLPNRTGYLLGLEVCRELSKKYSLDEMVNWKAPEVHSKVIEGLKAI